MQSSKCTYRLISWTGLVGYCSWLSSPRNSSCVTPDIDTPRMTKRALWTGYLRFLQIYAKSNRGATSGAEEEQSPETRLSIYQSKIKYKLGNLVSRDQSPRESLKSISPYNYPKRHPTRRRDWDLFPIPSQCNVQNHCKWVVPGSKAQMDMLPISY